MITFGKAVFNLTGYMTKKELMRRAQSVGQNACTKMQEVGRNLSSKEFNEILENVVGKKAASRINISTDKPSLIEALMQNLGIPKINAEAMADQCLSAVIPKGKGTKAHLNLQVTDMPLDKSVNIIPHETEHVLHRTLSFDSIIPKLLEKTSWGKKVLQKIMNRATLVNEKNFKLQGGLIKMTGWSNAAGGIASKSSRNQALLEITQCSDKNMLRQKIKEMLYKDGVIEIGNDKQNNFILKALKANLKDESRAYNAGGYVENLYRQNVLQVTGQSGTTKSEVVADLYDEAIQVINKERKHIQWNRLKEIFGFKANRTKEQEIIDSMLNLAKPERKVVKVPEAKIKEMLSKEEITEIDLKDLLKNIES